MWMAGGCGRKRCAQAKKTEQPFKFHLNFARYWRLYRCGTVRFERYLTMSVAGEVTYARRFAVKFVEIVAAGIGTAVSGYLVAYIAGHFSLFMPGTVETPSPPPQASGWPAAPRDNASIESTVRAALASHDVSRAATIVATPQPLPAQTLAPASAETQVSETQVSETPTSVVAVAPPLAPTEIRSLPVAAVDSALTVEPDGWPSNPANGTGRTPAAGPRGLPPQPPPVNVNLITAIKHFF
jgi:hypothetical protein